MRQRAVHERQHHPRRQLLHRARPRRGRGRPASTARRGCGRRSSRCRRLQQRVVEEEHEPAARLEHPGDLRDRGLVIGDVLEHETHDHRVERAVGERQRVGVAPRVVGHRRRAPPRARAARPSDRRRRRPGTVAARPAGRPGPRRSRRRAPRVTPARYSRASGRICSSYSASAPSVKPSCHQPALRSHSVVGRSCGCTAQR